MGRKNNQVSIMIPLSKMPPEQAAATIADLIEDAPPFNFEAGNLSIDEMKWIGRADAILHEVAGPIICGEFSTARHCLYSYSHNRNGLLLPLYQALALVELKLPVAIQGSYIPPGDKWNGYSAVVKLLTERADAALVVDPYMDGTFITDFVPLATKMEAVYGLTSNRYEVSLKAASERWATDRKPEQPISIRVADAKHLHDRLIIFGSTEVYLISQSLKDIGAKSPASIQRAAPVIAAEKAAHYTALWEEAVSLVCWSL